MQTPRGDTIELIPCPRHSEQEVQLGQLARRLAAYQFAVDRSKRVTWVAGIGFFPCQNCELPMLWDNERDKATVFIQLLASR